MPTSKPFRVLIIEDTPEDTQKATTIFHKLGLEVQSKVTVLAAHNLLEDVAAGEHPAPHLIVLDLGFALESGFEVLRYWKSVPALAAIPVIVWTEAGDQDRKIASYFHVAAVVEKSNGLKEFEAALTRVIAGLK